VPASYVYEPVVVAAAPGELTDDEYADLVARIEEIYASFLPALEPGAPDPDSDDDLGHEPALT
jgi:hypothetical protein